jgi:ribosomal protein S6--L-glutamate ligase
MCVIKAEHSASRIEKAVREFRQHNPMMYIQQMVELPGQDMGMVFLGGEYLGSYARVSQGKAWNTTINSGGRYAACTPDDDIVAMARRAQALFDMDFTTVDVAETPAGPIVFEVSAFGGFRGAHEGIGVNAAGRYAEYVLKELEGGQA